MAGAYLASLGFTTRWADEPSLHQGFFAVNDGTSFPLWLLDHERMTEYVDSAYRHFKHAFFQEKDLSFLVTYLGEILNNVFDHAFAQGATERIAFAMLQFYPKTKRLFISVADFGMGIPASVNRFLTVNGHEPLTTTEALQKALERDFTTKSKPYNRGRGLDTLRTGAIRLGSTLTIQTSQTIYSLNTRGEPAFCSLPGISFPGTTVSLRINYNNLSEEEADTMEDEASFF